MLPGNLQYWQPCKWPGIGYGEYKGTIDYNINEPIHFAGPSPGDQTVIAEEEKKEQAAAQQSSPEEITPPVKRPTIEEMKEPEPSQTIEPAGVIAMGALYVDAPSRVNQQPIQTA